jgi:hypothetical protein
MHLPDTRVRLTVLTVELWSVLYFNKVQVYVPAAEVIVDASALTHFIPPFNCLLIFVWVDGAWILA